MIRSECENVRELVAARLEDALDESGEARLRAHLGSCESCRGAAEGIDPTLLFRRLEEPEAAGDRDDPQAHELLAAIRAGIDVRATERRAERARTVRRLRWLAAAAVLVATLFLAGRHPWSGEVAPPHAISRAALTSVPTADSLEAEYPAIEELDIPNARIYELGAAAADQELSARIVMIVGEGLDV